jgi:hypothetical protein
LWGSPGYDWKRLGLFEKDHHCEQTQHWDIGIWEACHCVGNVTWQSKNDRVLCRFQQMCVQPCLREECYGIGVPENVTKLINATNHRRRGVHFPTKRCPTTLAYGCLGLPQWKPTVMTDWSCISHRQHHLHMTTMVTRHDSVWFLPLEFHQGQCLLPSMSEDASGIVKTHQQCDWECHRRHAWEGLARMGVPLGHLPRHT